MVPPIKCLAFDATSYPVPQFGKASKQELPNHDERFRICYVLWEGESWFKLQEHGAKKQTENIPCVCREPFIEVAKSPAAVHLEGPYLLQCSGHVLSQNRLSIDQDLAGDATQE
jgi:hypothetical protein